MEERLEWLRSRKPTATISKELYEFYDDYCQEFGDVSMESYKRYCREVVNPKDEAVPSDVQMSEEQDNKRNLRTLVTKSAVIRTVDDLLKYAEVDLNVWMVNKSTVNVWGKQDEPMYQVKAELVRRAIDDVSPEILAEKFKKLVENYTPTKYVTTPTINPNGRMAEFCLFDYHFGQLSWGEETGEDYDINIAEELMDANVDDFLCRTSGRVEKFLLPIGNDFFNADNHLNTTFAGTPQQEDTRWAKTFKSGTDLWIKQIDKMLQVAPVDIVIVPGNHDRSRIYYLGAVLEAYYRNNPNVRIDNQPTKHKPYEYGETYIFFTHGDNLHAGALPLLAVQSYPELFAKCKYTEVQKGHWHNRNEKRYQLTKETMGITELVLPSLVAKDDYHSMKGYASIRQSELRIYDYTKGITEVHFYRP